MLEISKYIQDLLYLHDCVIIPDFGGFVANYRAASIDENQKMIYPPSKDIGFNCSLNRNDGLLIKHLADAENLAYADAEKAVAFFVEDLCVQLQRGENVTLENIGRFYYDKKFNLQFQPDKRVNYLIASYGLDSFELTSDSNTTNQTIAALAVQSNHVKRSFTLKRLGYVSGAAACFMAIALLPTSSENSVAINSASIGIETSLKSEVQTPQISSKEELVAFTPKVDTQVKVAVEKMPMYYLVAGCFSALENAERLKNKLQEAAYPATVFAFKNLQAVAINKVADKSEIITLKREFQKAHPEISCWILKK